MSNRDGKQAKHRYVNREYWSRRLAGCWSWGRVGKWMTHKKERAKAKIEVHKAKISTE